MVTKYILKPDNTTAAASKNEVEIQISLLYNSRDLKSFYEWYCQQPDHTAPVPAPRSFAPAVGGQAHSDHRSRHAALCGARLSRSAGGRYRSSARYRQRVDLPAFRQQGRPVLRGIQARGSFVSQVSGCAGGSS